MTLLTKKITENTFESVVSFCEKEYPEGVEIDYKKEYPQKGLQKLVAAFSNTRGGVIIIGVEENKKSGKPVKWEGIEDNASYVERANQELGNITPLPDYQIHKTSASETGKVFLLIRVFEGNKTPYYVHNDANIWIRTGNVAKAIDIASPEWVELLIGKHAKAEKARNNYLRMADIVYDQSLKREERRRLNLIEEAKKKADGSEKNYYQKELGTETGMCEITVLPFYPKQQLIPPQELLTKLNNYAYFPDPMFPDPNLEPIPEGVLHFKHAHTGYIECQQLYSIGLVYNKLNIMQITNGQELVHLSWLAGRLFRVLKVAGNIYKLSGYQGSLSLGVRLTNIEFMYINYIQPEGLLFWDGIKEFLLDKYTLNFELDTRILNDKSAFFEFYYEAIKTIYWYVGLKNLDRGVFEKFVQDNHLEI